ncbi:hypothetical protein Glove_186g146 [Diversispora epigaea]|uniref:Uncharacterized protein n=1 Tax=Diversispora epigaea TaxID=1348612 RepID=A0A397IWN3_9GLOM|nr:hypothetical protein Glove_186g146 [Diversispora epigaea]
MIGLSNPFAGITNQVLIQEKIPQLYTRKNATDAISQYIDFSINDEKPIPIAFIKKFNFFSKKESLSSWNSTLSKTLEINKNDPKLVEVKQLFENGYYRQGVNDCFRQSESARTLEKEKTSIDKTLTNKTRQCDSKRITDLLPEETGDQKFSKKPCLKESDQKTNQRNNEFCLSSSNPDSEFNAQEINKKGIYHLSNAGINMLAWVHESYNLSAEFRNFQKSTIDQIKKDLILYYKSDIQKILPYQTIEGALDELIKIYGNEVGLESGLVAHIFEFMKWT